MRPFLKKLRKNLQPIFRNDMAAHSAAPRQVIREKF